MATVQSELQQIDQQRQRLAKSDRLHWYHWVVCGLSLVVTVFAWRMSQNQIDHAATQRFERAAEQVVELVQERLVRYEDALWAGVAAIQGDPDLLDDRSWATYSSHLRLAQKYPGINGIGVILHVPPAELPAFLAGQRVQRPDFSIHPPHDRDEFWPITYIEPVDINAAAVGLDMAHETNRLTAAKSARDSGEARITAPITLVQDAARTPGFLFYAPFYTGGRQTSLEDRQRDFKGLVYAPFIFSKLIAGTLDRDKRRVVIKISDDEAPLYDEVAAYRAQTAGAPQYQRRLAVELFGRSWQFDIQSTVEFDRDNASAKPKFILAGGILIDAMLLALFATMANSNRRTLRFADRVAGNLQERTEALTRSNAELEKFAYVASHDLKTPIRGIGDLAEFLREDLDDYFESADAHPEVRRNLDRIDQQVTRMNNLIKGILGYSSLSSGQFEPESFSLERMLEDIAFELDLAEHELTLKGLMPDFKTDTVRLEQVLSNLIGNAQKYHDKPGDLQITVTSEDRGDFWSFAVTDNGPGIDARFHSRIFDVFQTLQTRDEIESTGIGLAIVKKSVELYGGTIELTSAPGEGATFRFDWPKTINRKSNLALEDAV